MCESEAESSRYCNLCFPCPGGSQPPACEDAQLVLQKVLQEEEPPAQSQPQLASYVMRYPRNGSSGPSWVTVDDYRLAVFDFNVMSDLSQNCSNVPFLIPELQRNNLYWWCFIL